LLLLAHADIGKSEQPESSTIVYQLIESKTCSLSI